MIDPNFILLYVNNPETSASFYADLLDKKPIEASATFAMFALQSGVMLGLWAKQTVTPSANANACVENWPLRSQTMTPSMRCMPIGVIVACTLHKHQ